MMTSLNSNERRSASSDTIAPLRHTPSAMIGLEIRMLVSCQLPREIRESGATRASGRLAEASPGGLSCCSEMAPSDSPAPSADQWQRVKSVFLAAIDIPEDSRPAFVAAACAGDEELLLQVQSLLRSDESADSFCEIPAARRLASERSFDAAAAPRLTSGVRLGAYEVVELIGAGGMGEVYRARDTRL